VAADQEVQVVADEAEEDDNNFINIIGLKLQSGSLIRQLTEKDDGLWLFYFI
jgi:hypothetical protein